jgi:hypothetical protein
MDAADHGVRHPLFSGRPRAGEGGVSPEMFWKCLALSPQSNTARSIVRCAATAGIRIFMPLA